MRLSRREFIERLGWGGLVLSGVGLAGALGRFLVPNVEPEVTTQAVGGAPAELAPGQATFLKDNRTWLMRDEGGFYALSATCTHLGCTVRHEQTGFVCPCHASEYDAAGTVRRGPATRALTPVWVGLDAEGRLVVDQARVVPAGFRLKL